MMILRMNYLNSGPERRCADTGRYFGWLSVRLSKGLASQREI
jgi:hypothetical protein